MATKQLYVLASNISRVKIGISADAEARMAQISSGSPIAIRLRLAFARRMEAPQARLLEREMHLRFAEYRLHGEWFSISVAEAVDAATELSSPYPESPNELERLAPLPRDRIYWKDGISLSRTTLCEPE